MPDYKYTDGVTGESYTVHATRTLTDDEIGDYYNQFKSQQKSTAVANRSSGIKSKGLDDNGFPKYGDTSYFDKSGPSPIINRKDAQPVYARSTFSGDMTVPKYVATDPQLWESAVRKQKLKEISDGYTAQGLDMSGQTGDPNSLHYDANTDAITGALHGDPYARIRLDKIHAKSKLYSNPVTQAVLGTVTSPSKLIQATAQHIQGNNDYSKRIFSDATADSAQAFGGNLSNQAARMPGTLAAAEVGGAAGATLGSFAGPVGEVVGGGIGGIAGFIGGDKLVGGANDLIMRGALGDDSYGEMIKSQEQSDTQNQRMAKAGNIAGMLTALRPGNPLAVVKDVRGALSKTAVPAARALSAAKIATHAGGLALPTMHLAADAYDMATGKKKMDPAILAMDAGALTLTDKWGGDAPPLSKLTLSKQVHDLGYNAVAGRKVARDAASATDAANSKADTNSGIPETKPEVPVVAAKKSQSVIENPTPEQQSQIDDAIAPDADGAPKVFALKTNKGTHKVVVHSHDIATGTLHIARFPDGAETDVPITHLFNGRLIPSSIDEPVQQSTESDKRSTLPLKSHHDVSPGDYLEFTARNGNVYRGEVQRVNPDNISLRNESDGRNYQVPHAAITKGQVKRYAKPTETTNEATNAASETINEATNAVPVEEPKVAEQVNASDSAEQVAPVVAKTEEVTPDSGMPESKGNPTSFTTALGSTYTVHEDGTTTRDKSVHNVPGHEGDEGLKPRSHQTIYVDHDEARTNLSGQQATAAKGHLGIFTKDGSAYVHNYQDDGSSMAWRGTKTPYTTTPEVGKIPIEIWNRKDSKGNVRQDVHFGNKIVSIEQDSSQTTDSGIPETTPASTKPIVDPAQIEKPVDKQPVVISPEPKTEKPVAVKPVTTKPVKVPVVKTPVVAEQAMPQEEPIVVAAKKLTGNKAVSKEEINLIRDLKHVRTTRLSEAKGFVRKNYHHSVLSNPTELESQYIDKMKAEILRRQSEVDAKNVDVSRVVAVKNPVVTKPVEPVSGIPETISKEINPGDNVILPSGRQGVVKYKSDNGLVTIDLGTNGVEDLVETREKNVTKSGLDPAHREQLESMLDKVHGMPAEHGKQILKALIDSKLPGSESYIKEMQETIDAKESVKEIKDNGCL